MQTSLTFAQLEKQIQPVLRAKKVPFVSGKPGVGKSALWRKMAEEYDLEFLDLRLSTLDPTMLNGFLWMDPTNSRATFKALDIFPLAGTPLPKGKKGWLLHLDEFTQAQKSVEGAAFQLVLDRYIGDKQLHHKCLIVCSGNPPGQGMIAKQISTPMRTRLIHFSLANTPESFTTAMLKLGFHQLVINYLAANPDKMNNFEKNFNQQDGTYACERSWEMLSDIIKSMEKMKLKIDESYVPLLTGTVGEEAGTGFYSFVKSYYACPDIVTIAQDPKGTALPSTSAEQYAALAYLVDNITMNNGAAVSTYISRFEQEFQLIFGRIIVRDKEDIFDKHFEFIQDMVAEYAI